MTRSESSAGGHTIVLVGFMGAGKTSTGQALARRLGWRFLDLDDVIEAREHKKIADIFREAGEAAFRRAEATALREVLAQAQSEPTILALGGGAFVQSENARALRQSNAPVVFLDAPIEELRRRCAPDGAQRPLFQDENQFRQLYEARRPRYMEADVRVDTTGLSPEQVADEIARRLNGNTLRVKQNGVI